MKNKKIIAEVLCPVISGRYDFFLSTEMTAGEALEKIAEEVRKSENADFLFTGESTYLYASGARLPLDPSVTLEEYGITDGSVLMLI